MGPYLGTPNKEKETQDDHNERYSYGACSMQGWRKSQEDAHISSFLDDEVAIFGVFDGHGGKDVSLLVKEIFVDRLLKNSAYQQKNYDTALKEVFREMDDYMLSEEGKQHIFTIHRDNGGEFKKGEEASISEYTGCTAVVVLITAEHIFCANSGDSRAVLSRNYNAVPLSFDHKPSNELEQKRIEAAGGFVEEDRVNGSLNLSRSLGDFGYKNNADKDFKNQMVTCDPEVTINERKKDDNFIILACDGIWDCLTNQDCVNVQKEHIRDLKEGEKYSKCVADMLDKICATDIIKSGGIGTDNMTCIVVVFK